MKTVVLTSSSLSSPVPSSVKSTVTTAMEDDRSESRDSCYFPGCRKDANCNCEICLASINATLDLMPFSVQKSSLTKFSASKPIPPSPISFNPSILSTPRTITTRRRVIVQESPSLKSTARLRKKEEVRKIKKNRDNGFVGKCLVLALCLGLIFSAEFGVSWIVSGFLKTELSRDSVRNLGEKTWGGTDLNEQLGFLQRELQNIVNGKIANCSYANSIWKMNQDGLLLHSRCTLYKSATEEVSIWGWPLQTAGLLATGFSSHSFTVLSGRVTEWSDGKVSYLIRKASSSWTSKKWSASVVQLDRNTWILEYRQSFSLENTRLHSAALEFTKLRMSKTIGRMKHKFWISSVFENLYYSDLNAEEGSRKIPT